MNNLYEKAEAARYFIQSSIEGITLDSCIITGTGLGEIWQDLTILHKISYSEIPHFAHNTVQSHQGVLYICEYENAFVAVLSGRFHYYEGHEADQIAFPVRVMKLLGIQKILITNVAGGLNERFRAGSIVSVSDHINMQPGHVLRGQNDQRFGNRFPDMLYTYDIKLQHALALYASENKIDFYTGVYLALQGPSLETPAEYQFLHDIGADLVGMSTIPEVLAAAHMNMKITCLSVVSNVCYPINSITETTVEEVIAVAKKTIPKLNLLMKYWLSL